MQTQVKINGIYKHYKGDYYIVLGIATHSETGEKLVVYRALYGDSDLYARPYKMFIEEIDKDACSGAIQKHRFELQDIKSVNRR